MELIKDFPTEVKNAEPAMRAVRCVDRISGRRAMIETAYAEGTKVFGLFELDDSGNVLYSRAHQPERRYSDSASSVGLDFFREVATFENRDDLRNHFRRFIASRNPADNFRFDCLFGEQTVTTRISMIRGHEGDAGHTSGIVIMDIRRESN